MAQQLMARKIKVESNLRCDWDHQIIHQGKYATQIVGDPTEVKAQGLYHGRLCYEAALDDYTKKKEELDMQEEAQD
jgi:hypothetical protein